MLVRCPTCGERHARNECPVCGTPPPERAAASDVPGSQMALGFLIYVSILFLFALLALGMR